MIKKSEMKKYRIPGYIILLFVIIGFNFDLINATVQHGYPKVDYTKYLNRRYKKEKRFKTKYIIIHTSEAGKSSTLRTLSKGKKVGNHRTNGGHANYAIARDGYVYRILDHRYRADHTGLSMWNGLSDLSSYSVGIELVGYHYGNITTLQYRSLSYLLKELKKIYSLKDKDILTHCQVSYGRPNFWFHSNHRGRKRCALNFEPVKAGLRDWWEYDPDVRARRLTADFQISRIFYGKKHLLARNSSIPVSAENGEPVRKSVAVLSSIKISNILSKENTAWNIAGEDYNKPDTSYILPGGDTLRGDELGKKIGWENIPAGTRVLLNHPEKKEKKSGPLLEITETYTAWSYAGSDYNKDSTFYFFPEGKFISGNKLRDWDSFPNGVKMLLGYETPKRLKPVRGKTAWGYAGRRFNKSETVYYIPGKGVVTGDKMEDFSNLPGGSMIFLKKEE